MKFNHEILLFSKVNISGFVGVLFVLQSGSFRMQLFTVVIQLSYFYFSLSFTIPLCFTAKYCTNRGSC